MGHSESILVVEDSPEIQELLKMLLEMEGYTVSIAGTGDEGLKLLEASHDFSLMLLDNTLPDMNSFIFLERMTEANLGVGIPIVLCSAASDLKQLKLSPRIVAQLPKPFSVDALVATVKKFSLLAGQHHPGLRVALENNCIDESRGHV